MIGPNILYSSDIAWCTQIKVAGIGPVEGIPNVHNIDLTSDPDLDIDLVYGHDDYRENLHAILYKLGV